MSTKIILVHRLYRGVANFYIQRIFDIGLNNYVTYTTAIPTVTPVPATTTPVGVGPFNSSTHTILSRYDDPTQDILGGLDVDTPIAPAPGDTIIWSGTSFEPGYGGGTPTFIWTSNPSPGPGIYDDWATLYAAVSAVSPELRTVLCARTLGTLSITAGTWNLCGWHFIGKPEGAKPDISIVDGAYIDISDPDHSQTLSFTNVYVEYLGSTAPCIDANYFARIYIKDTEIDATGGQPFYYATGSYIVLYVSGIESYTWGPDGDPGVFSGDVDGYIKILVDGMYGDDSGSYAGDATLRIRVSSTMASDIRGFYGLAYTQHTGPELFQLNNDSFYLKYDDALVVPQVGATDVQTAIDKIKAAAQSSFVWAPGFPGGASGNIYLVWADLYAAVLAAPVGARKVYLYDNDGACNIPSGSWNLRGWVFSSFHVSVPGYSVTLNFLDGAELDQTSDALVDGSVNNNYRVDFENLEVACYANTVPTITVAAQRLLLVFRRCHIINGGLASYFVQLTAVANQDEVYVRFYETYIDTAPGVALFNAPVDTTAYFQLINNSVIDGNLIEGAGEVRYEYDGSSTYIVDPAGYSFVGASIWNPTEPRHISVTGSTNVVVSADVGTPEVVVGGLIYSPSNGQLADVMGTWDKQITFAAMASAPTASAVVRLYDIGSPGTLTAPVLVSEVTALSTDGAKISAAIGVDGTGTPALDTVAVGLHLYEIRVVADAAEDIYVYWAGIRVNDAGGA